MKIMRNFSRDTLVNIGGVLVFCSMLSAFFIYDAQTKFQDQMIWGSGQIVWLYFEGGFWGLEPDTGKDNYEPFNLPEEFEDIMLWDFPLLQYVDHISDFALIVVISSGTEKARQWTEQVHPAIGETPLIMVVSTGTEPIVRPYYEAESKQIDGILSGLPSAMIYEGVNGLQADATHRWDGYGTSVLIVVLILFAGFGYGAFTWLKKQFLSREG